jgi:uncharacterized protein YodC (DUF2158 family)
MNNIAVDRDTTYGDRVVLKSGGLYMTVSGFNTNGVHYVWLDERGCPQSFTFTFHCLNQVIKEK